MQLAMVHRAQNYQVEGCMMYRASEGFTHACKQLIFYMSEARSRLHKPVKMAYHFHATRKLIG